MVEGALGKGKLLGAGLDERYAVPEAALRDLEHLEALVEPGDPESSPDELGRDEPRSRGDVEDATAVHRQAGDEEAAPARVLAERERRADAVVRGAERGEQLAGVH